MKKPWRGRIVTEEPSPREDAARIVALWLLAIALMLIIVFVAALVCGR